MSSAARETKAAPAGGADLPHLRTASIRVREADPDPPPGDARDALAALGETRIMRHEADMELALDHYLERVLERTLARMGGPRVRKGTRYDRSADQVKSAAGPYRNEGGDLVPDIRPVKTHAGVIEYKAVDAGYVLPAKVGAEIREVVRPVAQRIVTDATVDTGRRLGREIGLAAFDQSAIDDAIEDAVRRMVDVNERYIAEIRKAITDADGSAADLDMLLDRIRQASRRGGHWVKLSGRTLAVALGNDAALASARALGVTHAQWISRRDERVRHTHRVADGQVRVIGERYRVGAARLLYPGDPSGLPGTWSEVAGCRCHLAFLPPRRDFDELFDPDTAVGPPPTGSAAGRLVADAGALAGSGRRFGTMTTDAAGVPASMPALTTTGPLVAYRVLTSPLEAVPGQWLAQAGGWVLTLVRPPATAGRVLRVAVPAGTAVGVTGTTIVLPAAQALAVVAVDVDGVAATLA